MKDVVGGRSKKTGMRLYLSWRRFADGAFPATTVHRWRQRFSFERRLFSVAGMTWRKPCIASGALTFLIYALIVIYRATSVLNGRSSGVQRADLPAVDDSCVRSVSRALRRGSSLRNAKTLTEIWDRTLPVTSKDTRALKESLGFWCESDALWAQRRIRSRRQRKRQTVTLEPNPSVFFYNNWEPDIGCALEERIGNNGDGGKWVCDPPAILNRGRLFREQLRLPYRCIVYSFGSNNDFSFETKLHERLPDCDFFVFDPTSSPPSAMHSESFLERVRFFRRPLGPADSNNSLAEIMSGLGHLELPNVVEVLKIDIEGGEFTSFLGAFRAADKLLRQGRSQRDLSSEEQYALRTWHALRHVNQVLIEVHAGFASIPELDEFFRGFMHAGFAIFHKEPNLYWCCGSCEEYAFIRMHDSFFEFKDTIHP